MGALDEKPRFFIDIADKEREVGVSVDAVDVGGDVDVADIAILDHSRVGDTVADDFV